MVPHFREASEGNTVQEAQAMLSPFMPAKCSTDDDVGEIFDAMKETSQNQGIKTICRNDVLIKDFTNSLLGRPKLEQMKNKGEQTKTSSTQKSVLLDGC